MAEAPKGNLHDLLLGAASVYPAALRSGVGYWSEMVVNASSYFADLVEAALGVARQPSRNREVLAELAEGFRRYVEASGDTFERAMLDYNQAVMTITQRPQAPTVVPGSDRAVDVWQQLADFAASQAMKIQGGQGRPDFEELRQRLDACLAELRRVESNPASGTSRETGSPG